MRRIFFSLDPESYKNCFDVCRAWKAFLSSDSTMRASIQAMGMWMDKVGWMNTENLERCLIVPDKEVIFWTTTGDEVACVENVGNKSLLHYIDKSGHLHTMTLRDRLENYKTYTSGIPGQHRVIVHMSVLERAILIETQFCEVYTNGVETMESRVAAVQKADMKESTLFFSPANIFRYGFEKLGLGVRYVDNLA